MPLKLNAILGVVLMVDPSLFDANRAFRGQCPDLLRVKTKFATPVTIRSNRKPPKTVRNRARPAHEAPFMANQEFLHAASLVIGFEIGTV